LEQKEAKVAKGGKGRLSLLPWLSAMHSVASATSCSNHCSTQEDIVRSMLVGGRSPIVAHPRHPWKSAALLLATQVVLNFSAAQIRKRNSTKRLGDSTPEKKRELERLSACRKFILPALAFGLLARHNLVR
jgi:hypothetical protein